MFVRSSNGVSLRQILRIPPLSQDFYQQSADTVAPNLLGKIIIIRGLDGVVTAGEIIEVEAYLGATDPASHAFAGPRSRNRSMFAEGGRCYVYLSYGMHFCMNVVTGPKGRGEAVLIRAVRPCLGIAHMRQRRGMVANGDPSAIKGIADGPGKLTQAMGINLSFDGRDFFRKNCKIVDIGTQFTKKEIGISPRIGISKAVDLPLRFFLKAAVGLSRRQ